MTTYTRKLVRGSAFVFLMSSLALFIGYLIRIVLARNLTPSEYGLFYSVFSFVAFFLYFRDIGLNSALTKYIPEFKVKHEYNKIKTAISSAFFFQTISSLIFGALLFIFSGYLAKSYFKDPSADLILKIFVAYILFSMIVLMLQGIFQGFQKITAFSLIDPLRNLISLLLIFMFLSLGLRVFAPIYALTLSWIIVLVIFLIYSFKIFNFLKYKIQNFGNITKTLFTFSLPVMLTSIGANVISRLDTLMLTYFSTLDQVGIYNVVLPTASLFLFFSEATSAILLPMVSELWAKKDLQRLKDWLKSLYKYSFIFIAPVLLAVFSFSNLFIKIFFGEAYISGARTMQILLIGMLFFIVARLINVTLVGIGKPATVTKTIIYAAIFNFFGNLFLIPRMGIEGAAIATTLSYLLVLISSAYSIRKIIKIKVPFMSWAKTFAASLVFVLVIYALKGILMLGTWSELLISTILATIVYLSLIFLFKLVDVQELKHYIGLVK